MDIAPDLPGFGYSATPSPSAFGYTFDAYAAFLQKFVDALNLDRYVIWLHDYGSQFGFRLALSAPDRVAGLVSQSGDVYEDAFGPKYDALKASRASSAANSPTTSPTGSAPTCGPCTGR